MTDRFDIPSKDDLVNDALEEMAQPKKKIEDYLHLFIGCYIKINDGLFTDKEYCTKKLIGIDTRAGEVRVNFIHGNILRDEQHWLRTFEVKPILRKLSSMTEEEGKELGVWHDWIRKTLDTVHSAEKIRILLSKGFDLFGLIESGLAIEKP